MNSPIQITIDRPASSPSVLATALEHSPRRASAFDLVAATPWAITPDMLSTIAAIAGREGEGVEAVEARIGRPLQNTRSVSMRGATAVIPVTGPVFRYANLMTEISGATSLEVLAKDFTAAVNDPAVSSIVLNIDSPGGQAAGIAELASLIRSSSKPVVSYVDGNAASAAYWLASAANEVVVSKTGMVGSIGAVMSIDQSKSKPGAIEIVSSQSPNKRPDASTEGGRAQIQSVVDKLAQVFIEDVATYRGISVDRVLSDFGQGGMRMGAESVALGMADRVSTFEEVIAGLAGWQQPKPAPLHLQGATAMNLDELRAAHPDLCGALVEEGRIAGAAAERTRIQDIEAQALPGHEALIAQFKADGITSGPEAAVAILKAERESNAQRGRSFAADAPNPVPHAAAPAASAATVPADAPIEDRAKAEWDKNAALRAEFCTFDTYLAFARAHDTGAVKVLTSANKE